MAKSTADQRVRILHLSDLHFSKKRKWDADCVLTGLADVVRGLRRDGLTPDLLAITGDIAKEGKAEDYQEARKWLDGELLPALSEGFPKDRLLMVPGNHDVDRKAVNAVCQITQSGLLNNQEQDQIAAILGDSVQRGLLLKRHECYLKFAGSYQTAKKKLPWWSASFTLSGSKLRVAGLCSSWMSWRDGDRGRLLIGRWQAHEALRGTGDADWSITLVHHPWSYLAEFDAEEVERKVHHECRLVLRGHLHRQQARAVVYPDDLCLELAAGCCYDGSDYPNAFQLIELDRREGTASVHFWLWNGVKWILDRNACPQSADGVATFRLKSDSAEPAAASLDLQSLVARIGRGSRSPTDLDGLRDAVRAGRIVLAGEGAVAISGDATGVVVMGHNNIVVSGTQASQLAAALHAAIPGTATPEAPPDPTAYLEALREKTAYIDIQGLNVGTGKATRLPIDKLYVRLTTTLPSAAGEKAETGRALMEMEGRRTARVGLHEALKHRVLLIVGDPGAGKTTFLRRIAFLLCQTLLDKQADAAEKELGLAGRPFPVLIRLADLARHIAQGSGPRRPDAPGWIAHYLASLEREEERRGFSEAHFRARLENGAIVLLDGLDEPPSQEARQRMARLSENTARAYPQCRFVLTSRPAAFREELDMSHCVQVEIADLEEEAIKTFLAQWCEALFTTSRGEAQSHCKKLVRAVQSRPEIRKMARNPVMLTALAVVHWNEGTLPEQRAELYESILKWLSLQRHQNEGRVSPQRCIALHQELALAMQDHPEGRQVQLPRYEAARAIAAEWPGLAEREQIRQAEAFLIREELDSGILVGRGNQVQFWHLTFQEYLAARALADRLEEEQRRGLLATPKLYQSEWRETVRLLAGVLQRQGSRRVNAMFSTILDTLGSSPSLSEQARCFGLIGTVLQDLAPAGYQLSDQRYEKMREGVLGIFDRQRSESVDIQIAIEAAEALGQAGDPRFDDCQREKNWVQIPAGEFLMGAQKQDSSKPNFDSEAYDDGSPVRKVYLDAYRIGRYPVTVREYQGFYEDGGYQQGQHWEAGGFGRYQQPGSWEQQLEHPSRPVVTVSWYEAAAYAAWAGCRLPTEAEWERAARGIAGRKYPWGGKEPNERLLNYNLNIHSPTPVGVYACGASPEGVLDMAGNVWQWCQDWWGPYSERELSNPTGPASSGKEERRVVRGGSWGNEARYCRCSFRGWNLPSDRGDFLGFRVVLCAARTL
jgi:formylglycine-generating enzyme required for sulfatase activity/predicted MPP superfamily phosphohydrolase